MIKQLEDIIMGAEEKLVSLEYDLFCEVGTKSGQRSSAFKRRPSP